MPDPPREPFLWLLLVAGGLAGRRCGRRRSDRSTGPSSAGRRDAADPAAARGDRRGRAVGRRPGAPDPDRRRDRARVRRHRDAAVRRPARARSAPPSARRCRSWAIGALGLGVGLTVAASIGRRRAAVARLGRPAAGAPGRSSPRPSCCSSAGDPRGRSCSPGCSRRARASSGRRSRPDWRYPVAMCRSIKTLRRAEEPATDEEIAAAALQFVRKVSGYRVPSQKNRDAFDEAVFEVAAASRRLLDTIARLGERPAGDDGGPPSSAPARRRPSAVAAVDAARLVDPAGPRDRRRSARHRRPRRRGAGPRERHAAVRLRPRAARRERPGGHRRARPDRASITGSGSRSRRTGSPRSWPSSAGSARRERRRRSASTPARPGRSTSPSPAAGGPTRSASPARTCPSATSTSSCRPASTSTSTRSARSSGSAGAAPGRPDRAAGQPRRGRRLSRRLDLQRRPADEVRDLRRPARRGGRGRRAATG